jgi:hypothetical protein
MPAAEGALAAVEQSETPAVLHHRRQNASKASVDPEIPTRDSIARLSQGFRSQGRASISFILVAAGFAGNAARIGASPAARKEQVNQ